MDTNAAGFDFRERILQHLQSSWKPTYAVWINLQQYQGQGCCSWLFESGQTDTMNAVPSSPSESSPNLQQGYTNPGPPSIAIAWDKAAKSRVYRCMR
ncbi:hypothetical protein CFAM422_007878 [Trichoderma lentiforme]|uniref:Uncharacterized protein n=1 Tax=Trichoderma lentiforme TaxID=1567552 RepID=A0A9P4XD17_9HYPO|nr:hypothetical protein CFAM422_007878 [Trichoderma lentiforme]